MVRGGDFDVFAAAHGEDLTPNRSFSLYAYVRKRAEGWTQKNRPGQGRFKMGGEVT